MQSLNLEFQVLHYINPNPIDALFFGTVSRLSEL